ncbi:MAG: shikimate kinase [Pyrinomonadaceae bacterium]
MGVGKSSVARHLSAMVSSPRIDLDLYIENRERRKISEIIDEHGVEYYRAIETASLEEVLASSNSRILSLGGGTWTIPKNRGLLAQYGYTSVWLESTFEHCWLNISFSRKDRPLARDKKSALALFEERQKLYCLADWHFIVRSDFTSYDVARKIADDIFS